MTDMGLCALAYVKPWDRPRPVREARHDSHGPRCLGLCQTLGQTTDQGQLERHVMTAMGLGALAYVKPWDRPRPVGEA
jgi:hypothetical protein